jgi:branched-chain amino acid transport system permease protein
MEALLQALIAGLLLGGVLALLSTGLALIFGVMRVVNFAQGDFVMLGMYFAFFAYSAVALPPQLLALLALPLFAVVGVVLHRALIGRVTGGASGARRGGQDAQLILTLGLSLILQNGALMAFGSEPEVLRTPQSDDAWLLGGIVINQSRAIGFLIALVLGGALFWYMQRTVRGRRLRAAADDPEAAVYVGVDVSRSHAEAFAIGVALAAAGGGIVATYYPVQPFVAYDFIVLMFAAVVLGGLGSVAGAFLGGLVIGTVQGLSQLVLPLQLQYVTVFVVFLAILYLRPQGILGRAVRA